MENGSLIPPPPVVETHKFYKTRLGVTLITIGFIFSILFLAFAGLTGFYLYQITQHVYFLFWKYKEDIRS